MHAAISSGIPLSEFELLTLHLGYHNRNHLVPGILSIMVSLAPRLESSYYGLNQRAWSRLDAGAAGYTNNGVPTNVLDRMELFYYDASWRLLERRTDESWNGTSFVHDSTSQWVWGQRYIDELVASITDGDVNDEFEDRFYAMTDRNFSVIGLSQSAGSSGERVRYDAYGHAQAMPLGDADHNGAVDLDDQNILLVNFGADIGDTGSPLYRVEADFDSNGAIDLDDLNTVNVNFGDSIERGRLSGSGNIVGYAGYIFEPATGMYVVRHRWYSTKNGRWLSRDPALYLGGYNLYEYAASSPVYLSDWLGLVPHTLHPPHDHDPGWSFPSTPVYYKPPHVHTPTVPAGPRPPVWDIRFPDMVDPLSPLELRRVYKAQKKCLEWAAEQILLVARNPNWFNSLPDCPCTISDIGTAPGDWNCLEDGDSQSYPFNKWRKYHPAARYQLRSRPGSPGDPGQQCVYDDDGKLITGGRSRGTVDYVSPITFPLRFTLVPFPFVDAPLVVPLPVPTEVDTLPGHRKHDVDPFDACDYAGLLHIYYHYRPSNNGNNCLTNNRDYY